MIKIRPVVLQKNAKKWENFESLQLAAECQSMNKNQSFIKIRPEVPKKMPKSENICETLQLAAEYHSIKQKSKFDQDQTSSTWENCQKLRNLWNFATGCRMPQHEQKSSWMKTSSSSEKCKKSKKILKLYNWLQSDTA